MAQFINEDLIRFVFSEMIKDKPLLLAKCKLVSVRDFKVNKPKNE